MFKTYGVGLMADRDIIYVAINIKFGQQQL